MRGSEGVAERPQPAYEVSRTVREPRQQLEATARHVEGDEVFGAQVGVVCDPEVGVAGEERRVEHERPAVGGERAQLTRCVCVPRRAASRRTISDATPVHTMPTSNSTTSVRSHPRSA